MRVSEVMSKHVRTVSPATSLKDLWKTLITQNINAVPVIDQYRKLIGIVTKEDVLSTLYPDYREYVEDFASASDFKAMEEKIGDVANKKIKDIMCKRVIFTRENTMIMRALSRMIARHVDQLPVLSDSDQVVGIITKGDIFKTLFKNQLKKVLRVVPRKKSGKK